MVGTGRSPPVSRSSRSSQSSGLHLSFECSERKTRTAELPHRDAIELRERAKVRARAPDPQGVYGRVAPLGAALRIHEPGGVTPSWPTPLLANTSRRHAPVRPSSRYARAMGLLPE